MVRIVGIGGGTGLPILLRGLRELSENKRAGFSGPQAKASAVVCVSDNGGSSGALRRDFGIPAVGDLRNCLVALAEENHLLSELFQYRFGPGSPLNGHPLGNLVLTALCQMTGSLSQACELASELLHLKGVVLPVTDAGVTLCAEFENGERACGELQTTAARQKIKRVWLDQEDAQPAPGVLETIADADAIVLGPGSLFTSLVPPLLVPGVADAIVRSRALKIFITNLMTQPGETDGFSASDHLRILEDYLGPHCIDVCVLNSRPVDWSVRRKYVDTGSEPVYADQETVARLGAAPIRANLFMEGQRKARHDPAKLGRLVMSLAEGALRARDFVCGPADFAA